MPSRSLTSSATWQPYFLSLLRIIAGLLFMQHGYAKLFGFPHIAAYEHLQLLSLTGASGFIETIFGTLVFLGLFARPAAFILSGEMAIGYFLVHNPQGPFPILNHGDLAVLFCFVFLYLFVAGPGPVSVDRLLRGGRARR